MSTFQMRVHKYISSKLYGFLKLPGEDQQVFFHLGEFVPGASPNLRCDTCPEDGCSWSDAPPPPITGELVEVTVDLASARSGKAPRASRVVRVDHPEAHQGVVETYDPTRGFGFIRDADGNSYYVHKTEVLDGRMPLKDAKVMFYTGPQQGQESDRPRACHIRICP